MAKVYISSVIPAPAHRVWAIIRDFNGLPAWTPFVATSHIEGGKPSDQIGCIRNFKLHDGGLIRETLLALSDLDMTMTYNILESPMGVSNYIACLSLHRVTDGDQTFATWTAEFSTAPGKDAELVNHIGTNVFQAAFTHLKTKL